IAESLPPAPHTPDAPQANTQRASNPNRFGSLQILLARAIEFCALPIEKGLAAALSSKQTLTHPTHLVKEAHPRLLRRRRSTRRTALPFHLPRLRRPRKVHHVSHSQRRASST